MKRFFGFALLLVLSCAPAFAGTNSQSLTIPTSVKVGTAQLAAGNYKVSWTGSGASAQVTIAKDGKTVATATAKVVDEKHNYNSVTTITQGGVNLIETIQLNKVSLVFGTAPTSGQ
jgi:hypothetical protein